MSQISNDPFVRDILTLLEATLIGMVGGILTVRGVSAETLTWPTRFHLAAFGHSSVERLRRYGASQNAVAKRKQLVLACFVWFFITFAIGLTLFGCSHRLGCR